MQERKKNRTAHFLRHRQEKIEGIDLFGWRAKELVVLVDIIAYLVVSWSIFLLYKFDLLDLFLKFKR